MARNILDTIRSVADDAEDFENVLNLISRLADDREPSVRSELMEQVCTLLGVQSWVRFCQQEFGEFPWPAWAVGSYSSGPAAGGTPQILVDKTLRMTSRLRV